MQSLPTLMQGGDGRQPTMQLRQQTLIEREYRDLLNVKQVCLLKNYGILIPKG